MVFNPNIPTAPQKLSVSQPLLLANNQQLDTSFGIDHYKFSDATANNGFHNSVTTPEYSTSTDPVTVANPVFYAIENTVNLGLLQYSRGPNNAVPTPVTSLHSPATPLTIAGSASSNVLDFTGIATCFCELFYSFNYNPGTGNVYKAYFYYIFFSSTTAQIKIIPIFNDNTAISVASFSGSVLRIVNVTGGTTMNDVFWTLNLQRVQV